MTLSNELVVVKVSSISAVLLELIFV